MPNLDRRAHIQPGAGSTRAGQPQPAGIIDMGNHKTNFVNMPAQQNFMSCLRVYHRNSVAGRVGKLSMGKFSAKCQNLFLNGLFIAADRRGCKEIF